MQAFLYRQLFYEARREWGLSAVNSTVVVLILVSILATIVGTEQSLPPAFHVGLAWLRDGITVVFALEYAARVYAAGYEPRYAGWRGRLRFVRQPVMIIDLIAVGPDIMGLSEDSMLVRLARIVRIVRMARLGALSGATEALAAGFAARKIELGLAVSMALTMLVTSATLMYWIEGEGQPEHFGSIPRALWWSVATLTTVGYGDVVPITPLGKFIAGATAIMAIGLVAMPAGIFAAAFSDAFQAERERRQQERKREREREWDREQDSP